MQHMHCSNDVCYIQSPCSCLFVFISGNCLAHCVVAKLVAIGWFCVYLCSFQEFVVKQSLDNKIIVIKLKYYKY